MIPMLLVSIACAGAHRTGTAATSTVPFDASPPGFERWVGAVKALPVAARQHEVDVRIDATLTTPLVDRQRAVLLWRGEAERVQWIGDASQWDPGSSPDLARVEGTDLWWFSRPLDPAARLDYKFLLNGKDWILDPRCLRQVVGGYGPNSELRMPDYVPPREIGPPDPDLFVWDGYVAELELDSRILGEKRPYSMYVPGGYKSPAGMPTVWFLDGSDYLKFAETARILDVLIARGEIPPVVAIFVPPLRRIEEYDPGGAPFLRFFTEELVPYVRDRYEVNHAPELNAVVGPSLGALGAARLALARPDLFGNVVGQSGAYHRGDDAVIRDVRDGAKRAVRFHLTTGTYDRLLEDQRRFAEALRSRGYVVETVERPDGHSWGFWRAELVPALEWVFGPNPDRPYEVPGTPR